MMMKLPGLLCLLVVAAVSADVLPVFTDLVNKLCPGNDIQLQRVCFSIDGNVRDIIKNPVNVTGASTEDGRSEYY